jgi:hypothetical protein
MFFRRIGRLGVLTGFCSTSLLLVGVVTSAYSTSSSRPVVQGFFPTVERAGKADRLTHAAGTGGIAHAIAVEVTGPSDVIVRDRDGNVLFAVDHSARTTTVGKQSNPYATFFPDNPAAAHRALPDGCEGAFSAYVEPARAHIIGRCVSGIFRTNNALT